MSWVGADTSSFPDWLPGVCKQTASYSFIPNFV